MATNTIKTRIQLKYDTEQNWNKAVGFYPLRGEVIIYSPDDIRRFCRIKIGDGSTSVVDLPFVPFGESGGNNVISHTTEYWTTHFSYIPSNGQIIIYEDYNGNNPAIKIGNGITYVMDLPFITAPSSSVSLAHSITFGANQAYTFDGTADVVVPVYNGTII